MPQVPVPMAVSNCCWWKEKLNHDRFLIIDDVVYLFGASLKDAGRKLFAYIKMQETSASEVLNNIRWLSPSWWLSQHIVIMILNRFDFWLILRKTHDFCKKIVQNDTTFRNNSYICTDSNSPQGWASHNLLVNRTFTNVIFSIWISQIQALEDTQQKRPLWGYCALSVLIWQSQYISAWAIELLILMQGNARARTWDRRSRAPTSFCYY